MDSAIHPPSVVVRPEVEPWLVIRIAEEAVGENLGDLRPRGGGAWVEGAVGVARHGTRRADRLDVAVGPVAGRDVAEGGEGGRVEGPGAGGKDHLGDLGAGDAGRGAEGAI